MSIKQLFEAIINYQFSIPAWNYEVIAWWAGAVLFGLPAFAWLYVTIGEWVVETVEQTEQDMAPRKKKRRRDMTKFEKMIDDYEYNLAHNDNGGDK